MLEQGKEIGALENARDFVKTVWQAPLGEVPLVLHMDATYKLNSNEYPVLILGLSDAQQQFHLLSISVLSHHTEAVYREVLRVFKRVIEHVLPEIRFSPQYVVIISVCFSVSVSVSLYK